MHRNKMLSSLKERVQAKVVKSVVDSVDFLTTMLNIATLENMEPMRKYMEDPINNPKPEMRVRNFKDFKEVLDSLQKLMYHVQTSSTSSKHANIFSQIESVTPNKPMVQGHTPATVQEAKDMLAELVEEVKEDAEE